MRREVVSVAVTVARVRAPVAAAGAAALAVVLAARTLACVASRVSFLATVRARRPVALEGALRAADREVVERLVAGFVVVLVVFSAMWWINPCVQTLYRT